MAAGCIVCCFFQAEDGIRDLTVTGVQTCALPILRKARATRFWSAGILGVYGLCLGILELAERIAPGHDVQTNFQRGHTAVSGFLGLLGLGLLYAGLKRGSRGLDRKSTRLNSSHSQISYAVFCLKKKKTPIKAL